MSEIKTLEQTERDAIIEAIRQSRGIVGGKYGAAKMLGMSKAKLLSRMRKHCISKQEISDCAMSSIPAVGDDKDKFFVDLKKKRAEQMRKVQLQATKQLYGSIDYIAKRLFRGEDKMVSYARLVAEDGNTQFQAFVEAWEADRYSVVPESAHETLSSLIKDAGINSIDFCVEVMRACMKRNMELSNIYAGLAHPQVVQRNIKEALRPKGVKDREMFLQHSGWLPQPKGSVVNVHAQAGAAAVSGAPVPSPLSDTTTSTLLPDFEEQTVEGSKVVREGSEDHV